MIAKRRLSGLLFLAAGVFVFFSAAATALSQPDRETKVQLDQIARDLAQLQTKIERAETDNKAVSKSVDAVRNRMDDLERQIEDTDNRIDRLESRLDDFRAQ